MKVISMRTTTKLVLLYSSSISLLNLKGTMMTTTMLRLPAPATEALIRESGVPRIYLKGSTKLPMSRKNSLTERTSVGEPVSLAAGDEREHLEDVFPKIEWFLEEEELNHQVRRAPSLRDDNDDYHSSRSSPILGMKTRRRHRSRLVRSKSLSSSLCYLAERSSSSERRVTRTNDGSWGHFVYDDDNGEETLCTRMFLSDHNVEELKRHSIRTNKIDLRFISNEP